MLKKTLGVMTALMVLLSALPAQAGRFGLGLNAGTTGAGVDLTMHVLPCFNLRAGVQGFNYTTDYKPENLRYDVDISSVSESLLLDYHPLDGGLRISAGVFVNQDSIDLKAVPRGSYRVDGITVTSAQIGTISGKVKYPASAPYIGIGWGNAGQNHLLSDLGLQLDLGVIYKGKPKVELSSDGTLRDNPYFQAALENERSDIEHQLRHYQYYPVLRLGLSYNF